MNVIRRSTKNLAFLNAKSEWKGQYWKRWTLYHANEITYLYNPLNDVFNEPNYTKNDPKTAGPLTVHRVVFHNLQFFQTSMDKKLF